MNFIHIFIIYQPYKTLYIYNYAAWFQAEGFEWHRAATDCKEAKDGEATVPSGAV